MATARRGRCRTVLLHVQAPGRRGGSIAVIDAPTAEQIRALTAAHWSKVLARGDLDGQLAGKEPGHALAPLVEVQTKRVLASHFEVAESHDAAGRVVTRDIADLWLAHESILHPVNVKCRVLRRASRGRPNMVSLVRLLTALAAGEVDSYYVLVVALAADGSTVEAHLGDLLAHLDHVAFDAGTGQLMATPAFFGAIAHGTVAGGEVGDATRRLFALYEDGVARLFANRAATLERLRQMLEAVPSGPGASAAGAPSLRHVSSGEQLSLLGDLVS